MRHIAKILLILPFLMTACLSDPVIEPNEPDVPSFTYEELTRSAVTIKGHFADNGSIKEWGFEQSGDNEKWQVLSSNPSKDASGDFVYRVQGLSEATTYYFRTFISNGSTKKYSRTQVINTKPKSEAEVSDVIIQGDLLTATIIDDGGRDITSVGFYGGDVNDVKDIQSHGKQIIGMRDGSTISARITSFEPGKTYWFIAFAENVDDDTHARQVGYSRTATSVAVTEAFPVEIEDSVFSNYLLLNYDTNHDGRMSYEELKGVTSIVVNTDSVSSLRGIERMPALMRLVCCGSETGTGQLNELDVTQNHQLMTLRCDNNGLRALELSGAPLLDTLSCASNRLSKLSVSLNTKLTYVDCASNQLTDLSDLSNNTTLHNLRISGNPIGLIDLSPCKALDTFDATGCPVLRIIYVWPDFFDEPTHTGFQKDNSAEYVMSPTAPISIPDEAFKRYCVANYDSNNDGEISVTEAKMATVMDLNTNEVQSMKGLSFFTELHVLRCVGTVATKALVSRSGRLSSLDVSGLTQLDTLDCSGNPIKVLDVSRNLQLKALSCEANLLESLDLSNNRQLRALSCEENGLAGLNLSNNTAIEQLNCGANKLIALDVSPLSSLRNLQCGGNQLVSLNLSKNAQLESLDCSNNVIKELDVSENRKLSKLVCTNNPLTALYLFASQAIPDLQKPDETPLLRLINSLTLNAVSLTLQQEETATLIATIDPADALDKTVVWTSSDEKVAAVSNEGVVTAVTVGTCTITASCGGKQAVCTVTVTPIAVESVTLDQTSASVRVGDRLILVATVLPENASDKTVTWSSSSAYVATVSDEGVVRGVSVGSCTITATAGEKRAVCSLTVRPVPVESVTLDKESLEIIIGDTEMLTATVLPENATYLSVSWESSDVSVATVSSSGEVTAVGVGDCTITATSEEIKATCSVTVLPIHVSSVTLDRSDCELYEGSSLTLRAAVSPSNATYPTVFWSSSDTGVATVSSDGTLTAVSEGSCIITASADGQGAICRVTVLKNSIAVTSISLDQTSCSIVEGTTVTLSATVLPSNATDPSVSWSSNDPGVATVNGDGVVTGKSVGSATITARAGNQSATCRVTVTSATIEVSSITLNTNSLSLTVGNSSTLTATVLPADATDKTVTWESNDTGVATVSSSGVVTAVSVGTCTVTAKAGGKTASCAVSVTSGGGGGGTTVNSISVDPTSYTLPVGGTTTITATVDPGDAAVTWTSSDESVAMVSQAGYVIAIKEGTTDIIATAGDKSATCKLRVIIPVTGITLDRTDASIVVGATTTLTATVLPANASDKTVEWSSNELSIATVSSDGLVTGAAAGSCIITATAGDHSATCKVTVNSADGYVPINSNTFPDDIFRSYVSNNFDSNLDGFLSKNEIETAIVINVAMSQVKSLNGIEYFSSLESLDCSYLGLTNLDVSQNTTLKKLYCQSNKLSSLNLKNNESLLEIDCASNLISAIDIGNLLQLRIFWCDYNQLSVLDVSNNILLENLQCSDNRLTELDVSKNVLLQNLFAYRCQLSSINVFNNTALRDLGLSNNPIGSIDVTNNADLRYLSCNSCQLDVIDVSKNSKLENLEIMYNSIKQLDISNNTLIWSLMCTSNSLTSLDCSHCQSLRQLLCDYNALSSIDVSGCPDLYLFNCSNNQLFSLDVTKNTKLTWLSCPNNQLSGLDVSNCLWLESLNCTGNPSLKTIWLKNGQSINSFVYDSTISTIQYR